MTTQQMELGFGGGRPLRLATGRQHRRERAAWWFAQMRQAVDRAMDWSPGSSTRPEQTWLPGTRREVRV